MNRQQVSLIVGSITMIAVLFFGFKTKPPKQRLVEKSRAGDVELRETQNAVRKAKAALPEDLRTYIQGIENIAEGSSDDSTRVEAWRSLSAAWFDQNAYVPAGYFAEKLAEIEQTPESWSIAGSTYGTAFTAEVSPDEMALCVAGAIRSYENAISLDPDNIEYRINLAICYAEHPPQENPMKGIQLLLELNRTHPDDVSVLYHLARFGMQTGQYAKAKERLEKALSLDPAQRRLYCLMADLLGSMQEPAIEVEKFQGKCAGK
jgi:tetratricopeptide (TPR) repeat protein